MNIFFLSFSPEEAAQMMCDKHVVKMILESVQIMCMVFRMLINDDDHADSLGLYQRTHPGNPCILWAASSSLNFNWLYHHTIALVKEHIWRYNRTVFHKSYQIAKKIGDEFFCGRFHLLFPSQKFTYPPLVMPDKYKNPHSVIESYRQFYIHEKADFAQWTQRSPPEWWPIEGCYRPVHPNKLTIMMKDLNLQDRDKKKRSRRL